MSTSAKQPRYAGVFPVVPTIFHEDGGLDLAGQNTEADAAYREALAGGASPRTVDAYGRFLEGDQEHAVLAAFGLLDPVRK